MIKDSEGRSTRFADDPDEDTIELELTPEQMLGLSQAGQAAPNAPGPVGSTPGSVQPAPTPLLQRAPARSATRFRIWPVALAAAVVGVAAVIAWWAVAQRSAPTPPAPAVRIQDPAPVVPPPAPPPEPQGPPVQVRNPFDATEIFEFPAGTSKTEARAAVAELLLQRARDRKSQPAGTPHRGTPRPARGGGDENSAAANPEPRTPRP